MATQLDPIPELIEIDMEALEIDRYLASPEYGRLTALQELAADNVIRERRKAKMQRKHQNH